MTGMADTVSKTKRKPSGAAAMGPGPGRPKGSQSKTTKTLKEAILLAAEKVGEDGKGKEGLTGYLVGLARSEPKAFSALLGRVLPLTIGSDGAGLVVTVKDYTGRSRDAEG